jgi:hypothetical protein
MSARANSLGVDQRPQFLPRLAPFSNPGPVPPAIYPHDKFTLKNNTRDMNNFLLQESTSIVERGA